MALAHHPITLVLLMGDQIPKLGLHISPMGQTSIKFLSHSAGLVLQTQ